jgi:hypothetical protein
VDIGTRGEPDRCVPADVAVTLCDARRLAEVPAPPTVGAFFSTFGWPEPAHSGRLDGCRVSRLHYGNEFCEQLLPARRELARVIEVARAADLAVTLATPLVSDRGLDRIGRLLPLLPEGSEVVVNDLGVLRLTAREFPGVEPVAGRQLYKMVKDPRLPSARWARLNPPGAGRSALRGLLGRCGVRRLEIDVPPYAQPTDFHPDGLPLSVHAPYGYVVKGRVCRLGSLHLEDAEKFAAAHPCRKECLTYGCTLSRPPAIGTHDLSTFQRGNTIFYRHGPELTRTLWDLVERGWVDRIVLAGDWNESRSAH